MQLLQVKTLLLLGFGISFSTLSYSQGNAPQGMAAQQNLQTLTDGKTFSSVRVFDNRYEGVKGSPYYTTAWVPGKIEIKTGNTGKTQVFNDLQLKYDVYSNYLLAVIPQSKDTLQLSTTPVISFTLGIPSGSGDLVFKRFKEAQALDPALGESFFGVLYNGENNKPTLVKRVAKKKIEANFKGAYSAGQTYDEIVDETQYYVVSDGKMQRVKLNKKSIQEAFPSQADKIKNFISSNKLAMSSEADLIKVVAYIQSI
ncbi:hypothetical protein [Sabulibacter ruber]|uniref:hypothetical protein n=1 Tax=Sabulibacter ruber TaxID=2811901 RepID=UPI001A96E910|nr:hypothetical protein [Sabulibacter ruber]